MESLEFAQNFSVEDTDVFAVTYPKSDFLGRNLSEDAIHRNVSLLLQDHEANSINFSLVRSYTLGLLTDLLSSRRWGLLNGGAFSDNLLET
ncbi:sulfotransferase family cytosolic 2B member 1-like isoform X1 [Lates japonicus]|uniref:Sulfotransferase family cytosolic 2B member 1-like isoform X1 n=1 Tax=Lates japonicus TaxID=270547 RepID=A0AAD3NN67_LATJO|nr:sulfotransferase family cytosolic 2B member 1-like isoform X1 [Lates japonicus]